MPRYLTLFALVLAAIGAGCSSAPGDDVPGAAPASGTAARTAAPKDGRPIEITADDTMKFSVTEIKAKPGEALSVTLKNQGTTPKFSMGHNWVLLALDTDLNQFVVAAAEAVTSEYVPATQKDRIIAATKLLGPKESDTVTFAAPTQPGRYPFLCSFPGHFQVGMRGVLIVE